MNKKEWKEKLKQQEQNKLDEIVELFRQYDAGNPIAWAQAYLRSGAGQLTRFSLLKALSSEFLKETDTSWLELNLAKPDMNTDEPLLQRVRALKEMNARGVSQEAIVDLVRVVQYETLFHVLTVLEGNINIDVPAHNWGVFEKDENGHATSEITGLYESLMDFDPSNREFRPRS
jgi:hypothetical protein